MRVKENGVRREPEALCDRTQAAASFQRSINGVVFRVITSAATSAWHSYSFRSSNAASAVAVKLTCTHQALNFGFDSVFVIAREFRILFYRARQAVDFFVDVAHVGQALVGYVLVEDSVAIGTGFAL
jgi:hypothetical protein